MKIENTIKVMKQIEPTSILIVKSGVFCYVYGRDAYIISYLFKYQIKKIETNYATCGFPVSAINKVMKKLEDRNINYKVLIKVKMLFV